MEKRKYEKLSPEITERIREDIEKGTRPNFAAKSANAIRRDPNHDRESIWRPAYARDVDKILHSPYYNRYTEKTQVFSFYKNDDITRRALHVQLVSRIARSIGAALNLNLDLIEAIALGHDIGHTPFGHAGERYIGEVYHAETGRYFNHNVHSVRVLDGIFPLNITLDTLDGIITHNGEFEMSEYYPSVMPDFAAFDEMVESCYVDEQNVIKIIPSTLEGCVVRVCDIIAYLGKDRQDAIRAKLTPSYSTDGAIGTVNAEIINNLEVNIIEHSYGKPYIMLDKEHYLGLKEAKRDNYEQIYKTDAISKVLDTSVRPMMQRLYHKLLEDLKTGNKSSPIFKHHIDFVNDNHYALGKEVPYIETEPNQIVVDYMASMTDDYCAELYDFMFPNSKLHIEYHGYFEDLI